MTARSGQPSPAWQRPQ